jgi:hypothetical protein
MVTLNAGTWFEQWDGEICLIQIVLEFLIHCLCTPKALNFPSLRKECDARQENSEGIVDSS